LVLALTAFAAMGSGCASFGTHLSPVPTAKGKTDVEADIDVAVTRRNAKRIIYPVPELGLRYGLGERADIGGKVNLSKFGGEINSRIALIRSESFDLGIIPGAGLALASATEKDDTFFAGIFSLPLIAGINFNEDVTLLLGGKLIAQFAMTSSENQGGGAIILYPGGSIGMSIKLGDAFSILPELNVLVPIDFDHTEYSQKSVFQGGLGFQFGN
jgi:hypothetical protein